MSECLIHRTYFAEDIKTKKTRAACVCGWWVECDDLLSAQIKAAIHDLELEGAKDGTPNEENRDS